MDQGQLLIEDLAGTQAFSDETAERVEWLKDHLWDALGSLTCRYPRDLELQDEDVLKKLKVVLACAWGYRNEIRLLKQIETDRSLLDDWQIAEWRFLTDKAFGPLPAKESLLN